MEMILKELKKIEFLNIKLLVDKKSSIDLANHQRNHGRSKDIERTYIFSRDHVNKNKLETEYCKIKL